MFFWPSAGLEEIFSLQHKEGEARKDTKDFKVRENEQELTHKIN